MGLFKTPGCNDAFVGDAIFVVVGQSDDLVGGHIGHVQYIILVKGHKTGAVEPGGEEAGGKTLRHVQT